MPPENKLYYGDNLDVLRRYVRDESVDLVYLDPPFNSRQDYNVLFAEKDGTQAAAQIMAFEDTWEWNRESAQVYEEVVESGGRVAEAMIAFHTFLGPSDMMAYLAMMAPRLTELHRVLKETGSIYLHCDPTASHYLKILMDAIFRPERFRNEISWRRSSAHSDTKQGMKRCGRVRDVILFYTKSESNVWNPQYTPYTAEYLESEYRHVSPTGRRYKETDLTAARPGGDTEYEWHVKRPMDGKHRWEADLDDEYLEPLEGWEYKGVPPYAGRFWAYSKENVVKFANAGELIHRATGMPRLMQFADAMPGIPLQDDWDDIERTAGNEDLGYPTQKPEALLERIILASSNEGEVMLDPFCGCGTAVAVAQRLKRKWIGIDITHLAVNLIRQRLRDHFGAEIANTYEIIGEPVSLDDAEALARQDPFQFQSWALGLVGARMADRAKRGADRGIDGRLYFHDDKSGKSKQIILSVKAGENINVSYVRDLRGVLDREKAEIGVLISMEAPSKPMAREAAEAGFYNSPHIDRKFPRIQILTIADLLMGKQIDYPRLLDVTYRRAPRARGKAAATMSLPLENEPEQPF